jgi:hypothetical protein
MTQGSLEGSRLFEGWSWDWRGEVGIWDYGLVRDVGMDIWMDKSEIDNKSESGGDTGGYGEGRWTGEDRVHRRGFWKLLCDYGACWVLDWGIECLL